MLAVVLETGYPELGNVGVWVVLYVDMDCVCWGITCMLAWRGVPLAGKGAASSASCYMHTLLRALGQDWVEDMLGRHSAGMHWGRARQQACLALGFLSRLGRD